MKHDLQAFSQDIVALIKTSGDTGDSGDKFKKSLQRNDFSVPTPEVTVSPLKNEWGQPRTESGDRKTKQFELVGEGVPSVPTVPTHFEEGRAPRIFEDNPSGWYAILEELKQMQAPEWAGVDRWFEMIEGAEAFLSDWSGAAHDLGWTAVNLFGVHPVAPSARYDVVGLVPVLRRGRVVALTERAATIRAPSKSTLTYRRAGRDGAVLLCGGHHALA